MDQVTTYWLKVVARAWRQSLELVSLDSWKRTTVFLFVLLVPPIGLWIFVGDDTDIIIGVLGVITASIIAFLVMFLWHLVELPAVIHAEEETARVELEKQTDTANLRSKKQDMLGQFLARGTALMHAASDRDTPPPTDDANKWYGELVEYLRSDFGPAYVARVNDGASAPVGYSGGANSELRNGVRIRLFQLQEFLKELSH